MALAIGSVVLCLMIVRSEGRAFSAESLVAPGFELYS